MKTILFTLLIILIAIHLIVSSALEGRTSHYVSLLDSPPGDSEKRITCPVYSIRLQNQTTTFTKYIASEDQFNEVAAGDWITVPDIASFKECAKAATDNSYKMFMWVDDVCSGSNKLFRRLSEPCNEETSTLVYMVERPDLSCETDYFILKHGDPVSQTRCIATPSTQFLCYFGEIAALDSFDSTVQIDIGDGCMTIKHHGGITDFNNQYTVCASPQTSCAPSSDSERPEFLKYLAALAIGGRDYSYNATAVGLKYFPTNSSWMWDTVVEQPDIGPEWKDGGATPPFQVGYITDEGLLVSGPDSGFASSVCCYTPHSTP